MTEPSRAPSFDVAVVRVSTRLLVFWNLGLWLLEGFVQIFQGAAFLARHRAIRARFHRLILTADEGDHR